MQGYEAIFILDPETGEEDQTGLIDKYKTLVGSNGGQVVHQMGSKIPTIWFTVH